jgi:hypothetical protein
MMVLREILGQLVPPELLVRHQAVDRARSLEHHKVPVQRALQQGAPPDEVGTAMGLRARSRASTSARRFEVYRWPIVCNLVPTTSCRSVLTDPTPSPMPGHGHLLDHRDEGESAVKI